MEGQGAYGLVPNLPAYTTDTTQRIGTDAYPQLIQKLPDYLGMVEQSSENLGAMGRGIVPEDVVAEIYQTGAEGGIGSGSYGGPRNLSAIRRMLGLTSYGIMKDFETALTGAVARTPIQQNDIENVTQDLEAIRAQYAAAPSPEEAAEAEEAAAARGVNAGGAGVTTPSVTPTSARSTFQTDLSRAVASGGNLNMTTPMSIFGRDYLNDVYSPYSFYAQSPAAESAAFNTGILGGSNIFGGGFDDLFGTGIRDEPAAGMFTDAYGGADEGGFWDAGGGWGYNIDTGEYSDYLGEY